MNNIVGVVTTTYPKYSLEEIVKGISNAGFKYIELTSAPEYFTHIKPIPEEMSDKDAEGIVDLCKEYSLGISSVAGHTRLMKKNAVSNFEKVIDAAVLFGANFVTTDTGEVKNSNDQEKFYKDISEIASYAGSKGVTVCLEMHGRWCNTGKKGAKIVKTINNPNIKLNYDTANVMFYGGVKAEEDIKYALPYMGFMHLKDRGGKIKEWNFPPLGDGNIDFEIIFDLIKDYKGPISVEIEFDGKEHSLEETNKAVKKSYNFLKSFGYV